MRQCRGLPALLQKFPYDGHRMGIYRPHPRPHPLASALQGLGLQDEVGSFGFQDDLKKMPPPQGVKGLHIWSADLGLLLQGPRWLTPSYLITGSELSHVVRKRVTGASSRAVATLPLEGRGLAFPFGRGGDSGLLTAFLLPGLIHLH